MLITGFDRKIVRFGIIYKRLKGLFIARLSVVEHIRGAAVPGNVRGRGFEHYDVFFCNAVMSHEIFGIIPLADIVQAPEFPVDKDHGRLRFHDVKIQILAEAVHQRVAQHGGRIVVAGIAQHQPFIRIDRAAACILHAAFENIVIQLARIV